MNAVIFTHPPDYALASISARALGKLGVRAVLAIDAADPVPEIEGIKIIQTDFRRGGNLNGTECIKGILRTLQQCADGDDYVLKVDSDTMVRSLGWLDGRSEPAVGLFDRDHRIFFGACYALRVDRLGEYREIAAAMPFSDNCPEDIEIGKMLPAFTYENRVEGCPFAGYSWRSRKTLEQWKEYEVIVFQPIDGMKHEDVRNEMLKFT